MWCDVMWCDVRWCEVRWGEVRWGEVRWGEVRWGEMRWDEMRWDEMRWDEMRWDEMRWYIWYDMMWYMIWYDIWYDVIWYDGMVWHDIISYHITWLDMTRYSCVWEFYELKLMSHMALISIPTTNHGSSLDYQLVGHGWIECVCLRIYVSWQWQRPFMEYNPWSSQVSWWGYCLVKLKLWVCLLTLSLHAWLLPLFTISRYVMYNHYVTVIY